MSAAIAMPMAPAAATTATILIVDDESHNRKLFEVLLRPEGYLTQTATNGEEALALIAQCAPDLILLDIMMPGMDGFQVAGILKANAQTANIPIIMVTANVDHGARLAGLNAGVENFLTKPVDRAELWLRVRNLLRLKSASDFLQSHCWLLEEVVLRRTAELEAIEARLLERQEAAATLFAEKERLRVTLGSIGDAVITADILGNISYLNPVAETLTGWRNVEAIGLPLIEVFVLLGEQSGITVPISVDSVLRNEPLLPLGEDTVLMPRGGASCAIEHTAALIRNAPGEIIGLVLVFHDVSQARKMAAQISHQAAHDALTGLINRREFERCLGLTLHSSRPQETQHTLLYLDLDQFKIVNDTCGHMAGDELLRQLTAVLQHKLRQNDILARLGGDEFGVLLESCPTERALPIAELLRKTVSDFHFDWLGRSFPIGVSIGLITYCNNGATLSDILRTADAACYVAKDKGRNRIHLYTPGDKELAQRHGEMGWIARLQKALEEDRFVLYSQKILALGKSHGEGEHHEVLLRMQDEDGSLIEPMAFIPAAERYGLMPLLDRWVISTAFAHYAERRQPGDDVGTCAINLSGMSICDEHFADFVREQFARHQVPPAGICFEITETAAITKLSQAAVLIRELKEIGCRFSLDDFGSGMSSFSYLKHLPVDYLKIDGSFVKDMLSNAIDHAMVESINHIGHVMGIQTITEFVENDQILQALRTIGVDFVQGFGIEKPKPYSTV